jgi:hypothetical protein
MVFGVAMLRLLGDHDSTADVEELAVVMAALLLDGLIPAGGGDDRGS